MLHYDDFCTSFFFLPCNFKSICSSRTVNSSVCVQLFLSKFRWFRLPFLHTRWHFSVLFCWCHNRHIYHQERENMCQQQADLSFVCRQLNQKQEWSEIFKILLLRKRNVFFNGSIFIWWNECTYITMVNWNCIFQLFISELRYKTIQFCTLLYALLYSTSCCKPVWLKWMQGSSEWWVLKRFNASVYSLKSCYS